MGPNYDDRSEIAFFDVETTVPSRPGQGFAILEFGAILVCPRKLVELHSYSTLVRPSNLSLISSLSVRCNGITREAVVRAPFFSDVADEVYDLLHGRIWAGHNILRFDCKRIQEAFAEIGRPAPVPKGTIDSLALLTQKFGRRAGNMKMASLATYFGLGQQTHRSLDDVRMNLEVIKYCSTVLFLESSLPDIFTENSWVSPNATTRSRSNGKTSPPNGVSTINTSVYVQKNGNDDSPGIQIMDESHPMLSLLTSIPEDIKAEEARVFDRADSFDMATLNTEIKIENIEADISMEDRPVSSSGTMSEGCSGYSGFLNLEEVSIPSIIACSYPFYKGGQRIKLLHRGLALQLCLTHLKVRFSIDNKYLSSSGSPRLSFVVDATPALCQVLDTCDCLAEKLAVESGSTSEWRHVVSRKNGFMNSPTIRLHIPTTIADGPRYATEMYRTASTGKLEKLVFSQLDAAELAPLLYPGTFLDAYISLDTYDYQQNAGIRLVAKKLVIHG
ncbi:hypothetical protein MLD38_024984 [Melastoma candidum]|uniref:Uncharacterized protein n=1 Tax=Melastoma candidum TaxID=119954 RepID=A0ACB9NVK6_9MYRT|nr:hypothetical protein MLD38_024984 [Melastoma candidum]